MNIWTPGMSLLAVEKIVIQKAYIHFERNKGMTASSLGICVRTLTSKLEQYEREAEENAERAAIQRARDAEQLDRARGIKPKVQNAGTGLRMEPDSKGGAEPTVSVHEREKVQAVLPPQTTDLRSKRRSG